MNENQKKVFAQFWAENRGDPDKEIQFILATQAQKRAVVRDWWTEKKALLQSSKASLNQAFIDEEHTKLDTQITEGEDLITNF